MAREATQRWRGHVVLVALTTALKLKTTNNATETVKHRSQNTRCKCQKQRLKSRVKIHVYTALHGMQTRSSDEHSVCPSVCLSDTRLDCEKKTVERSVLIYIPHERTFSLVFWEEEWLLGATPCTWNLGSTGPRWSKIADFKPIIARSASAVTPSEKIQLTLIGSLLRAFQWA